MTTLSAARFGAFTPGAHHIELASGRFLDLADPKAEDITLSDVAHGLSHACRFAGHSRTFYSVAEHATLCAARVRAAGADIRTQVAALHHDDTEAFLGDVTRPLKALMPGYRDMEHRLASVVADALGLPSVGEAAEADVKSADDWALSAEAYHLLPSKGATWFCSGYFEPEYPVVEWVDQLGLSPERARRRWLNWHSVLMGRLSDAA